METLITPIKYIIISQYWRDIICQVTLVIILTET